jgi:hypothetical protein
LIAQLSTPISPENLISLHRTNWDFLTILSLTTERLTPGDAQYDAAVNALADLDNYGAIILAATSSSDREKHSTNAFGFTIGSSQPPMKDTLTIYFTPENISVSQEACDLGIKGDSDSDQKIRAERIVHALWDRLKAIYHTSGNAINLTTKGGPTKPPLFSTFSALGVLQNATGVPSAFAERELIKIDTPEEIERIRSNYKTSGGCDNFYTLDRSESEQIERAQGTQQASNGSDEARYNAIAARRNAGRFSMTTMFPDRPVRTFDAITEEKYLGNSRRFMLIAESNTPPPADAFASVRQGDHWYYILNDDKISQFNLGLISQITTIEAVPSQTPPLTPSISVGPRP